MSSHSFLSAWLMAIAATVAGAEEATRTWNFDDDAAGQIAQGFSNDAGAWSIVKVGKGKVLAQTAKNANAVFNITLASDTNAKDVDITVDMKPIAGQLDQGGGIVWRAADARNYYLARYNPLEDNYRLYQVSDGQRTMLQDAKISHVDGVHTLRVMMSGDHIQCFFGGKEFLNRRNTTFASSGKIGLWTKADAQTQFDNLILRAK